MHNSSQTLTRVLCLGDKIHTQYHPHPFFLFHCGITLKFGRKHICVSGTWFIRGLSVTHCSFTVWAWVTFIYKGRFTVTVSWPAWHTDPVHSHTLTHSTSCQFPISCAAACFTSGSRLPVPPTLTHTHVILTGKHQGKGDHEEVIPMSVRVSKMGWGARCGFTF